MPAFASVLDWWPLLLMGPPVACGLLLAASRAEQVLGRLAALQASLGNIARDTATLPRLQADVMALQHRLAALEKAHQAREGRILRIAAAVGALRAELRAGPPPR